MLINYKIYIINIEIIMDYYDIPRKEYSIETEEEEDKYNKIYRYHEIFTKRCLTSSHAKIKSPPKFKRTNNSSNLRKSSKLSPSSASGERKKNREKLRIRYGSKLPKLTEGTEGTMTGGVGDDCESIPHQSLCQDTCDDKDCNEQYTPLFIYLWRFYILRAPHTPVDTDTFFNYIIEPDTVPGNVNCSYTMKHKYKIRDTDIETDEYIVKLRIRITYDRYRNKEKITYSILIEYDNNIHLSYFYNYHYTGAGHCLANVCAIHFTFNDNKSARLDYTYKYISDKFYTAEQLNLRRSLILFAFFLYKLPYYIAYPDSNTGIPESAYSSALQTWLKSVEFDATGRRIRPHTAISGIVKFLCSVAIGLLNYINLGGGACDTDNDKKNIEELRHIYSLNTLFSGIRVSGGGNKLQLDKITNYNIKIAKLKEDIKELRKNKKLNKINKKKELIEKLKLKIKKEKEKLKLKLKKEKLKIKKEKEKLKKARKK